MPGSKRQPQGTDYTAADGPPLDFTAPLEPLRVGSGRWGHMTLFPLLERELRTAARQATTYSVRLVGATGALAAVFFFAPHPGHPGYGAGLFNFLHQAVLASIWIFVPFLTAGCRLRTSSCTVRP